MHTPLHTRSFSLARVIPSSSSFPLWGCIAQGSELLPSILHFYGSLRLTTIVRPACEELLPCTPHTFLPDHGSIRPMGTQNNQLLRLSQVQP